MTEESNVYQLYQPIYKEFINNPKLFKIYYFDDTIDGQTLLEHSLSLAYYLLERGISKGDRIAVYTQNIPQFIIAELASWFIGAIVTPLNIMLKSQELEYYLSDSEARAIIALEREFKENVKPILDRTKVEVIITTIGSDYLTNKVKMLENETKTFPMGKENDFKSIIERYKGKKVDISIPDREELSMILYTSGTTGKPKGAMYTHFNLFFTAYVFKEFFGLDRNKDIIGIFTPLSHNIGACLVAASLYSLTPALIMYRFEAGEALRLIEKYKVTFGLLPSTGFIALMNHPDFKKRDISSFRKLWSGGAPVPPSLVEEWEKLTGTYIHTGYGMTETSGTISMTPLNERAPIDSETGALAVGKPIPYTEVKILDPETHKELPIGQVGEIAVRGSHLMKGYWKKPEETERVMYNGWLLTGDLGKMDEKGWLYYVDRLKDLIVVSGFKVWPREVEDVIYKHPGVKEVAVVGIPDPYRGEVPKAYVVLKDEWKGKVTEEEIINLVRKTLANYKVPRAVEFVDELPKTASGKIMRRLLKEKKS
ncbi:MAG: AMP-binding protein [Sulfolobaceae archaeon]